MNKNQTGFAILETVLLFVIAVVIGGIGWYAIHTKHQTDKILFQADKISQETPAKPNNVSNTESGESNQTTGSLVITEWNIELKTKELTSDAIYKVVDDHTAYLTTSSYEKASGGGCGLDAGTGTLIRGKANYQVYNFGAIQNFSSSYISNNKKVEVNPAKVGDYYYIWIGPQAPCFNTADTNLINSYQKALSDLAYSASPVTE